MAALARCPPADSLLGVRGSRKTGFFLHGSQLECFSNFGAVRFVGMNQWVRIPLAHGPRSQLQQHSSPLVGIISSKILAKPRLGLWVPFGNANFRAGLCVPSSEGVVRSIHSSLICFCRGNSVEDGEIKAEHRADGGESNKAGDGTQITEYNKPFVWRALERWDVPWDLNVTFLGMFAWLISFLVTGLTVAQISAYLGIGKWALLDLEKQALYILAVQLFETVLGLGTIFAIINRYKPLSPDLFAYDWSDPLDVQRGWLLWGAIGVLFAGVGIAVASTITSTLLGEPPSREEGDALLQLLPLIGASPISTATLFAVTGVLAPLMEETVFRGFLMTSLSKWLPTPAAIVLSSCAFAIAHLTPGEFPQLFALGVVLGFSYSQTRNLLSPILIHSVWNSGVIILLTFLRLQGYNIRELI